MQKNQIQNMGFYPNLRLRRTAPEQPLAKRRRGGRVRWARRGFKLQTCFSSAQDWEVDRQMYLAILTNTFLLVRQWKD